MIDWLLVGFNSDDALRRPTKHSFAEVFLEHVRSTEPLENAEVLTTVLVLTDPMALSVIRFR